MKLWQSSLGRLSNNKAAAPRQDALSPRTLPTDDTRPTSLRCTAGAAP
jgi:hypothetical protein